MQHIDAAFTNNLNQTGIDICVTDENICFGADFEFRSCLHG